MYHGYYGRKTLFVVFLLSIIAMFYCILFESSPNRILVVSGVIFFWVGFLAGLPEWTSVGRHLEREDQAELKKDSHN